tara:strand:- start:1692 stop:1946 length:255 start_codon:yes stop_codon:yes gene_type:complete
MCSLILAKVNKKYFWLLFIFFIVLFTTPAQLEYPQSYAPALPSFIFNVVLEQNYSFKVLRPLFLTLPFAFLVSATGLTIKRKFF